MKTTFYHKTVFGYLIYNDQGKQIEIVDEKNFNKKYSNSSKAEGELLSRIMKDLKEKKYLQLFKKENTNITISKLKESLTDDILIINTIKLVNDLDKVANLLTSRYRETYEYYNPELSRAIVDNEDFIKSSLEKSKLKDSIGCEMKKKDLDELKVISKKIEGFYSLKRELTSYINDIMKKYCPNILALTGTLLGAQLIEEAGSLKKLSQKPASAIQVLGAEKALFRHLKTGAKPPRHGIIIQHPLISSSKQSEHGKRARALADKLCIAAKVDFFKGKFVGDRLKQELELKFS